MSTRPRLPMRETCGLCGEVNAVGFHVPDDVWAEVVHPSRIADPHCLRCFVRRADEKLIAWDREITFLPQSFRSHMEAVLS